MRLGEVPNLQMGQRLFCPSHWSTHSTWKRCMQGKRLTSSSTSNSDRQMVHLSASSSSGSSAAAAPGLVNLWGKVFLSMQEREAPRVKAVPARRASACRRMYSWGGGVRGVW